MGKKFAMQNYCCQGWRNAKLLLSGMEKCKIIVVRDGEMQKDLVFNSVTLFV
jgi:hypothetical protein